MKDAAPQTIRLEDYRPYPFKIEAVHLTFQLHPTATRVLSTLSITPLQEAEDLDLMGEALDLKALKMNGNPVDWAPLSPQLPPYATGIRIDWADLPQETFTLEVEVEINPQDNTVLEGLYLSKGIFCTQCEAEGFRRIIYYPDRPDVMSTFTVRIESDLPVLLSNGNPTEQGDGWAEWHDPWPKPAYLFALVAGGLVSHDDTFTTSSGKHVDLRVWVRPGDEDKCAYAMDALKRSMRWDEEAYGCEYDLDIFQIVAVDDFNMGAMENKGLNVFNSAYVLASPETATDMDYEWIESIIAHEYFHNWTGNRITCRDWFQLSLKEGLTVFRDQQFSGDQRSHAVKRIDDVVRLRARQFREDNGPLSHPVRPSSYVEINNFYTATVYEKGAEVIRMLKCLVGDAGFDTALALYFERHDGDAATIEDWLQVFEDATGRDLTHFKRWYTQSGTPKITVKEAFDAGTYRLTLRQQTKETPGQPEKGAQVIPVAVGLLGPDGTEASPTRILELTQPEQTFEFTGLLARPIPSLFRGFSAPVILERDSSTDERAFLLAHDSDPFNKWEAGRALAKEALVQLVTSSGPPSEVYLDALRQMASDDELDPAFRALALRLPSEDDTAQSLFDAGVTPDPTAIHTARKALTTQIAEHLRDDLPGLYDAMATPGPYAPDAKAAGRRALRQAILALMARPDNGAAAQAMFETADNMTEQLGALGILLSIGAGQEAANAFYDLWAHERLVVDKWFSLQITHAAPDQTAGLVHRLVQHPEFDWRNPNRFRAVFGALCGNAAGFHAPDGASYALFIDWLIKLDPINPRTAARMTSAFETWRRYDEDRQEMIKAGLERLRNIKVLSRDTREMVDRILGQ